jgi:hypothetical protein
MTAPKKQHTIKSLNKRLEVLEELFAKQADPTVSEPTTVERTDNSINKVESFNGEEIPLPENDGNGLTMNHADRMQSLQNVVQVLAPSFIDKATNRHTRANLSSVCGFTVTEQMHDEIYSHWKHEGGFLVAI